MSNVEELIIFFAPGLDLVQIFIEDTPGSWRNWLIFRSTTNALPR
jgi:hypothetical protein